jgi:transcription antitermination protein NusB
MSLPAGERREVARPPREPRRRAREAALQMLYQWEVGRTPMPEVPQAFWDQSVASGHDTDAPSRAMAEELAAGVSAAVERLDPLIAEAAEHWRLDRMQVMDRLILRLAVYELQHCPELPAKVIINEALELARTFSGDDAVRFVNGVLDAIRRRLERA